MEKAELKELLKSVRQAYALAKQYNLPHQIGTLKERITEIRDGIIEEHRYRMDIELEDRRKEP